MERIKEFREKKEDLPFRYVNNEIDLKKQGDDEEQSMACSVMYKDDIFKREDLAKSFETALGIGNIDVVEQVVRKHEQQRRQLKCEKNTNTK